MTNPAICMVSTFYYPYIGGAEKLIERLSHWLVEQDVSVMVITREAPDAPSHEVHKGVEIYRIPVLPGKILGALSFIIMACVTMFRHRHHFNIIHTHQIFSPTTIGWIMSRLLSKPMLVNLHGGGPRGDLGRLLRNPTTGQFRLNQIARDTSGFISVSDEISKELVDAGIGTEHIHLMRASINTDEFTPVDTAKKVELRDQLDLPQTVPLVIYVGRLVDGKGLETLLDAWELLESEMQLIIVGSGHLEDRLRKRAEQHFPDSVQLVGAKSNVVDYLQASNIWTLPSFSEGLPVSLLEAMSCAMPVVTTPVGGIPQLIEDGVNGWLVPPGDPQKLATTLEQLVVADDSIQKAGQLARDRVISQYSMHNVGKTYYDLYKTILSPDP